MTFHEIDLFGLAIAPIVPMMMAAYAALLVLRRLLVFAGVMRRVWHPALFDLALFTLALAGIALAVARSGGRV